MMSNWAKDTSIYNDWKKKDVSFSGNSPEVSEQLCADRWLWHAHLVPPTYGSKVIPTIHPFSQTEGEPGHLKARLGNGSDHSSGHSIGQNIVSHNWKGGE